MSFRLVQTLSWSNSSMYSIAVLCCGKPMNLLAPDVLRAATFIVRRTDL
jgi:hypothetical protein